MADGEGFARRVTLENLEEFREFLGTTPSPSENEDTATEGEDSDDSDNDEEGAGKTRSQQGREAFPGEGFPIDLPFAPRTPPDRQGAGGTVTKAKTSQDSTLTVLVAALPASKDRWGQANFTLDIYENYFGAKVGTKRIISLQHVRSDGTLEDIEQTESVESKSHNYRFELDAAQGDPPDGRPISVFLRLENRMFLYRLLTQSDNGYDQAAQILETHWDREEDDVPAILRGATPPEVPRVLINVNELRRMWPDCPLLDAVS